MGKQINFFINEDDLISFGNYIQNEMNGVFILRTSPIDKVISIQNILDIPYMSSYITMDYLKESISLKKIKSDLYSLDSFSTVVHFDQGKLFEDELRSARLFYHTSFYNQNGELESFPEKYLKWCENIFKWIKKTYKSCPYPEFKGYRISNAVLNQLKENKLKLLTK